MTLRFGTATLLIALAVAGPTACSSTTDDDPEAFCLALGNATTATGAVEHLDIDVPASVETAVAELEALVELAPEELAEDVETVAAVFGEILDAVATTAPAARGEVLRDLQPRLDEAAGPAERLQAYGAATCGLTFDVPARPTPVSTPLVDIDD